MKTKSLFFVLMLAFAFTSLHANTNPNGTDDLRIEIVKHLEGIEWSTPTEFTISFFVAADGSILVTNTSNKELDMQIKNKLNYKKLKNKSLEKSKVYTIPVIVKKA